MKNLSNEQKNQLRNIEKKLDQIKGFCEGIQIGSNPDRTFDIECIEDMSRKIVGLVEEADEIIDVMMDDV